jgi:hypothetical protein
MPPSPVIGPISSTVSFRARHMLHPGLELSRHRLEVQVLNEAGELIQVTAVPPDADGLGGLVRQLAGFGEPVAAAIESMNGARFVHDQLELDGWEVQIADAQKVKGLAPLAGRTDRIDAWVLAELSRRELVPASWLPDPRCVPNTSGPGGGCPWSATGSRCSTEGTPRCWGSGGRARQRPVRCRRPPAPGPPGVPEPWAGTTAAAVP